MATDHSKFQRIVILDYGSQYTQLIARRIREQQVFSEIIRFDTPAAKLRENMPQGIILSGGPNSVFEEGAPGIDPDLQPGRPGPRRLLRHAAHEPAAWRRG